MACRKQIKRKLVVSFTQVCCKFRASLVQVLKIKNASKHDFSRLLASLCRYPQSLMRATVFYFKIPNFSKAAYIFGD